MVQRRNVTPDRRPSLPPVELRRQAYKAPSQSIETPLTGSGLVDTRQLIKLVKGTLNSVYKWPSGDNNRHHLFWPNPWYPNMSEHAVEMTGLQLDEDEEAPNPHTFRNKPVNQIDTPDSFHAWLHEVTAPPPVPTLQTMRLINRSQTGINNMNEAIRIGRQLMRNKRISGPRVDERMEELFAFYNQGLDMIGDLPPEFHPIDVDEFIVGDPIDMLNIRGSIGHLAVRPSVAMTTRIIRQDTIGKQRDDDELSRTVFKEAV